MVIEVRGIGFENKGAELMIRAICEHYYKMKKNIIVIAPPRATYSERASIFLQSLIRRPTSVRQIIGAAGRAWVAAKIMHDDTRCKLGIYFEDDVDAVLDASGFAYSDQWGARSSINLKSVAKKYKQRNVPVVLLPQAFGPFEGDDVREAFTCAMNYVDMAFARDHQSLEYLNKIPCDKRKLNVASDFTNLVSPEKPEGVEIDSTTVCIVPNYRMIDKTDKKSSSKYLPLLVNIVKHLISKGYSVIAANHEGPKDGDLVKEIGRLADVDIPCYSGYNAAELKWILSQCKLIVSSRFHALVGGLSQGVPCVGIGWSHKYLELFRDYSCEEYILNVDESSGHIIMMIESALADMRLVYRLKSRGSELRKLTNRMWIDVDKFIGLN